MKLIKITLTVAVLLAIAGMGFVYGGFFNVAADDPHWGLTQRALEATRERSIITRARGVEAPSTLDDPKLIAMGAQEYDEMCVGCHLSPGMEETEIRTGLYPKPPKLAEPGSHRLPNEAFWVIKHGLKMTGMPAWGLTHDDQRIWSMVAFLQKLPELSPDAYRALTSQSEGEHSPEERDERSEPAAEDHEHSSHHK